MFEIIVKGIYSVEKFYSLGNAIERASHISVACSDVDVADVVSSDTGEVLVSFLNGEVKYVADNVVYKS